MTKVYYTCTLLNMINFIVKDYVLRTHTEQCTIESQYFGILEKKHERSVKNRRCHELKCLKCVELMCNDKSLDKVNIVNRRQ